MCLHTLCNSHTLRQPNHLPDVWLSDSSSPLTLSLSSFWEDHLKATSNPSSLPPLPRLQTLMASHQLPAETDEVSAFWIFSHISPASKPNFTKITPCTHYSHCFTAGETPVFTNVSPQSSIIQSLAEWMANTSWGHSLRRKGKGICCVLLIYLTKLQLWKISCEKNSILSIELLFLADISAKAKAFCS